MDIEKFLEDKAMQVNKAIEKYVPRTFTRDAKLFQLIPPRYSYSLQALNKAVAEPVWEFLDRGGKRWRPAMFLLIIEALGRNPDDYRDFAIIPEVVHNGTLMIDDLEDSSEMRRGKPCTYKLFGVDIAVNAGNVMYYIPLLPLMEKKEHLSDKKRSEIYEIYVQEMLNLGLGQAMDIAWHRGIADANNINEADYMQMCAYKTGTLARMAARIAAVLADADKELVDRLGRLAENIGVAFQMQDDILDLTSKEFEQKKGGVGQDITEGKRTLMVIHTLKVSSGQDRKRLIEILDKHTSDQKLKNEAVAIMKKYGAIDHVRQRAKEIVKESWLEVDDRLPKSTAKEKLKAFVEFLIERNI